MINIICVGKIKEQYLKELIEDYRKRINKYHKVIITELKDSDMKSEGELILKAIKPGDFVITTDINGKMIDSLALSHNIEMWLMKYANIDFIIGGSDGIDECVKNIANYKISFGAITYPHGLFRGILLEQIYRSFKIINNETYHK